jgi:hypothetical protein
VYHPPVRALLLILALGLVGPSCIPAGGAPAVQEARPSRRVARENRALRREVRALRTDLANARVQAQTELEVRRREAEVQSAVVAGLAQQVEVLARTIGELEQAMRAQNRTEAPALPGSKNPGPFSKLRVGSVPTQSPTLPEPRENMDQPDRTAHPAARSDPFSKSQSIPPRAAP